MVWPKYINLGALRFDIHYYGMVYERQTRPRDGASPMKARSILIVESSRLFQTALTTVLSRIGAQVMPSESAGRHGKKYDAVLVDIATFPGGTEQLSELVEKHLEYGPILLLAREDRIDQIITGLRSGAVGFLTQTASERDLRRAIDAVANGFTWCDSRLFRKVTRYLLPLQQWQQPRLTRREEEVLHCIGSGQTNKEIAQCLAISVQSVKVYVSNLLRKTGVANRSDLAMRALCTSREAACGSKTVAREFPLARLHSPAISTQ